MDSPAVARKTPAAPARRSAPARAPARLSPPAPTPSGPAGGSPLAPQVAIPIAQSLGVDVSPVRVHTGPTAASAAEALGARAFALGSHVVLGAGERPTDLGLMAHEVAHVVQQQAAPRVQLWTAAGGDGHEHEAHRAAAAVTARRRFSVLGRTRERVQRWGVSDVLDWFADKANLIPGYRLFTVIIGVNPINMARVERSGANILRALVELIPGGNLITRALDGYGVFERAGAFVEQQFRTLGMTGAMFRDALLRFIDSLGWRDIFRPGSVWERAKRIFTEPVGRLIDFGKSLVAGIIRLIKDAILRPLARLASRTRAWDLLCAVLGRNPITGEAVPRTAETLIGGFMKLIGQEEVWRNIQRARAIPRAWAWFQGALAGLISFVSQVPRMFLDAMRSLEIADIVVLPNAFMKVGRAFVGFIGRFLSWAGQQVLSLLQIIFEVLAPAAVPYLRKAAGAFRQIISDPTGFIRNLVRAGIQGFRQFGSNFLSHLRRSLIQWLTGTLAGTGVYIPQAFELREVVKFVLSVLGLTWQNIRGKLVRLIPDPVVRALETGFDIVVTLVNEGPAAAWDKIREQLSNLKEMVMEQIMTFVRDNVITAAITKLVSSLNPAGAFIQAVIAIYNTVMFFIERLRQIAQVAMSFIDSISAIAAGGIGTAANRVEQTMAGLLTLVISFLARLVGLGNVSAAVTKIVDRIRAPIDRALDRVVDWIVATARRLGRFIAGGRSGSTDTRTSAQKQADLDAAGREASAMLAAREATPERVRGQLPGLRTRYRLTSALLEETAPNEFDIALEINPKIKTPKKKFDPSTIKAGDSIRVRFQTPQSARAGFLESRAKFDEPKYRYIPADVTAVAGTRISYRTKRAPAVSGSVEQSGYSTTWVRLIPGTSFAVDAAWQAIQILNRWTNGNDARQVLNWRHHYDFPNPSGMEWEHIVEQSADVEPAEGRHSVGNMALTTVGINADANTFFNRPHGSFDGHPSTDNVRLRVFLRGKPATLHRWWKERFYGTIGKRVARKTTGTDGKQRGDYQVLE
jgi:hypothetical protein